jgi:tRNA A-37 threonylcarbamoyl transferase component Bud32
MAFVEILPPYRVALAGRGFTSARAFLDWTGVILSGHPSRHVLRVRTGNASFILKKEHRVPLRDRLGSAWAGFGWSSKSVREARLLERLRDAGVPCPEVVALGEDGGQAFLLLREQTGMVDLREFLSRPLAAADRRMLARALGRELARIHAAGFTQPDLYAKHILVRPARDGYRFCFLDWQRSRLLRVVRWRARLHDLAALDASLAAELVPDRLRLVCLRAYVRDTSAFGDRRAGGVNPLHVPQEVDTPRSPGIAIRRLAERRLHNRKTRELRQPPLPAGAQQLVWLQDDEQLCLTREFHDELGGQLPSWLPQAPAARHDGVGVEHRLILLGAGRTAHLVQRWGRRLQQGKFPAAEFAQAAMLFRLQRFGVRGPRLLGMGHRRVSAWQRYAFLLTEPPLGPALDVVLRQAPAAVRQRLLRQVGRQLRQLHAAGFTLRAGVAWGQAWVVVGEQLALASVKVVERTAVPGASPQAGAALSRVDRLRVLLGYLQRSQLGAEGRAIASGEPLTPKRERRVA